MGQALGLLLKCNSSVEELAIYDIVVARGVAVDLSHINTPTKVTGHIAEESELIIALKDADIVIVTAGIPQKVIFVICVC